MPEDFTIRPATLDDAESIMSMIAEFKAYLRALGDDYAFISFTIDNYRRDGFGEDPAFSALIVESGGRAMGYAIYAFEYSTDTGKRNIFLHDLFVRAEYRGRGVGEKLMKRISEICKSRGGDTVAWCVWHANETAIRFYRKIGAETSNKILLMRLKV
jgi:GNAT superfamily N-acetyltransferase